MKHYTIALLGNPNVGKSAWINALCHADFKVGNWPGVTIEKKEARVYRNGCVYHFIDLPGTYSLTEEQEEGAICARFLARERVDLILNVCDSMRLKRSLRLTLAARELQRPMIVLCGFGDEARRKGVSIDTARLSAELRLPICLLSAYHRGDPKQLWEHIEAQVQGEGCHAPLYPPLLSPYVAALEQSAARVAHTPKEQNAVLYAVMRKERLDVLPPSLRQDIQMYLQQDTWARYDTLAEQIVSRCAQDLGGSVYGWIDRVVLHPLLAYPLCVLFFWWFIQMVFQGSSPWSAYIQMVSETYVAPYLLTLMASVPPLFQRFFVEGVLQGITGVLSFVPMMGCLYFWIAFLEESGYMARIGFLADRVMSYFHLSGKALMAMVLGFGCNVAGIAATTSLQTQKQRTLAALLVPFMSCGARLPVYLLFCASFFKGKEALVIASLYGIGLFVAFAAAFALSHLRFFQETTITLAELPPYRLPSLKVLGKSAVHEMLAYLRKACSIVLMVMMVLWCFSYLPNGVREESYLARGAKAAAPLFEPLGFADSWECIASLPGGVIAKESIVGFLKQEERPIEPRRIDWAKDVPRLLDQTLDTIKRAMLMQGEAGREEVRTLQLWEGKDARVKAYSFLVFVLLSVPCVMSLSALARLYGRRVMLASALLMSIVPYLFSMGIYQLFSRLL